MSLNRSSIPFNIGSSHVEEYLVGENVFVYVIVV
jgi:hypothetical protein